MQLFIRGCSRRRCNGFASALYVKSVLENGGMGLIGYYKVTCLLAYLDVCAAVARTTKHYIKAVRKLVGNADSKRVFLKQGVKP